MHWWLCVKFIQQKAFNYGRSVQRPKSFIIQGGYMYSRARFTLCAKKGAFAKCGDRARSATRATSRLRNNHHGTWTTSKHCRNLRSHYFAIIFYMMYLSRYSILSSTCPTIVLGHISSLIIPSWGADECKLRDKCLPFSGSPRNKLVINSYMSARKKGYLTDGGPAG